MMVPEWLYYIMNDWLNGRTMMDSLAEQIPGIESALDPRQRIRTHSVIKNNDVIFDFNLN
jgi:hypothetical protein